MLGGLFAHHNTSSVSVRCIHTASSSDAVAIKAGSAAPAASSAAPHPDSALDGALVCCEATHVIVAHGGMQSSQRGGGVGGAAVRRQLGAALSDVDALIDLDGNTREPGCPDPTARGAPTNSSEKGASVTRPTILHYLGTPHYPLGSASVDFFLSSAALTPPDYHTSQHVQRLKQHSGSDELWAARERLVLLPHYLAYFPPKRSHQNEEVQGLREDGAPTAHHERPPEGDGASRADLRRQLLGVKDSDAFVFACLNQVGSSRRTLPMHRARVTGLPCNEPARYRRHVYLSLCGRQVKKIDPLLFGAWADLLARRPRAVLWLPQATSPQARRALRLEAAARGVSPGRVVFSARAASRASHLARLARLADAGLDTPAYAGGSVAAEALAEAGLPLVTLAADLTVGARQARCFAGSLGRVAAALVTHSMKEYVDVAARLQGGLATATTPVLTPGAATGKQKPAMERSTPPSVLWPMHLASYLAEVASSALLWGSHRSAIEGAAAPGLDGRRRARDLERAAAAAVEVRRAQGGRHHVFLA